MSFREFVFKWRGGLLTPVTLWLVWMAQPTISSLFVGACLTLLGEGVRLWAIGYTGEPTRGQELDAPALITGGPYSLVRNPLYLGNLLNGVAVAAAGSGGLAPAQQILVGAVSGCSLALVYGSIVPLEEEFLEEQFGNEYRSYRERVPAILPRSFAVKEGRGSFSLSTALAFERVTLMWLVLIWTALFLKVT